MNFDNARISATGRRISAIKSRISAMTNRISAIAPPYIGYRFSRQAHELIDLILTYPQGEKR